MLYFAATPLPPHTAHHLTRTIEHVEVGSAADADEAQLGWDSKSGQWNKRHPVRLSSRVSVAQITNHIHVRGVPGAVNIMRFTLLWYK